MIAWVAAAAGLVACVLLIVQALDAQDRAATRARETVLRLLSSNIAETPAVIGELAAYRRWADPMLKEVAADLRGTHPGKAALYRL